MCLAPLPRQPQSLTNLRRASIRQTCAAFRHTTEKEEPILLDFAVRALDRKGHRWVRAASRHKQRAMLRTGITWAFSINRVNLDQSFFIIRWNSRSISGCACRSIRLVEASRNKRRRCFVCSARRLRSSTSPTLPVQLFLQYRKASVHVSFAEAVFFIRRQSAKRLLKAGVSVILDAQLPQFENLDEIVGNKCSGGIGPRRQNRHTKRRDRHPSALRSKPAPTCKGTRRRPFE